MSEAANVMPWTCAKCTTTVAAERSICRACGAPRPDSSFSGPSGVRPPAVEITTLQVPDVGPPVGGPDVPVDGAVLGPHWTCSTCRTSVEAEFDVCWECGTSKGGVLDPAFQRFAAATAPAEGFPEWDGLGPNPEDSAVPHGAPPDRTCLGCGETLVPIQLIDSSGAFSRPGELRYAAGDAQRGRVPGAPIEGIVRAQLCPRCGRVELHAVRTS